MSVLAPERERIDDGPAVEDGWRDLHPRRRRWRRRPSAVRTLAYAVLALVLVLGVARVTDLLPSMRNPFTTERVDRSQPALLHAIDDLSEYHAATGHFEVILDLEQDTKYLPSFLKGERTLFVAAGTVDAVVDFRGIAAESVEVSGDRSSVTIRLPRPELSDARVDPKKSYVFAHERGLLDRVSGAFSDTPEIERPLYLLAGEKLETAAAESELVATAETNTRAMLEGLVRALGFTTVTVSFG